MNETETDYVTDLTKGYRTCPSWKFQRRRDQ